jgi:UDP-glucose 4-epimerase
MPWGDDEALAAAANAGAALLLAAAATAEDRWAVIWVAGAAVTSTPPDRIAAELHQLGIVLDAIADEATRAGSAARGSMFYASSAGGVYGGSEHPPFDETAVPVPISGYGRFKLDAERLLFEFSRSSGVSVVAGRIANLYGPGQNINKMQGLISHLAKAQFSPAPASIFVPLDTIRDYIYVRDCAEFVLDIVARLLEVTDASGRTEAIKNVATGQAVTIANLLGHIRNLARASIYACRARSGPTSISVSSRACPRASRRLWKTCWATFSGAGGNKYAGRGSAGIR